MEKELRCKDCKPPERSPTCHSTCKYYLEWDENRKKQIKAQRKKKWLDYIGNY